MTHDDLIGGNLWAADLFLLSRGRTSDGHRGEIIFDSTTGNSLNMFHFNKVQTISDSGATAAFYFDGVKTDQIRMDTINPESTRSGVPNAIYVSDGGNSLTLTSTSTIRATP